MVRGGLFPSALESSQIFATYGFGLVFGTVENKPKELLCFEHVRLTALTIWHLLPSEGTSKVFLRVEESFPPHFLGKTSCGKVRTSKQHSVPVSPVLSFPRLYTPVLLLINTTGVGSRKTGRQSGHWLWSQSTLRRPGAGSQRALGD